MSDSPDAAQFLAKYDSVSPTDREYLSLEEIALAADLTPKRLLEVVVSALVDDSRSLGAIISASSYPGVIQATAVYGRALPANQGDRKLFLEGTGFVPRPRPGGVFTAVNVNLPVPDTPGATLDDPHAGFTAAEDDLRKLHEALDGTKLLEAPKTVVDASATTLGHQYSDSEETACLPTRRSG